MKFSQSRSRGVVQIGDKVSQSTIGNSVWVRVCMVLDSAPAGAQAQSEDILQDFGGAAGNISCFKNMASTSNRRYRIISEKIVILNPAAAANDAATTGNLAVSWNAVKVKLNYLPKTPRHCSLKAGADSTPQIGNTSDTNIFLLNFAVADNATVTCNLTGCARAYYAD